jgi:hypothetical protein
MLLGRLASTGAAQGRHDLGFSIVLRESTRRVRG